jgi:hypothetical protein
MPIAARIERAHEDLARFREESNGHLCRSGQDDRRSKGRRLGLERVSPTKVRKVPQKSF